VKIASHHAEAIGESAGIGVEKRLLLADFADSGLAFGDGAAMAAGKAADAVVGQSFIEAGVCLADALIEDAAETRH
jgi:hypothetical protein